MTSHLLLQGYLRFDAEDKRWVCVECGNRYRQKVYAREHVVYKHIGADQVGDEQVRSCQQCVPREKT